MSSESCPDSYKASDVLEEVLEYMKVYMCELELKSACLQAMGDTGSLEVYESMLESFDKKMDQVALVYFCLKNKESS